MPYTTRSRSGAAPKQVDAEVALQKSFSSQSLLAWATGSRGSTKKSGTVRRPQNNASILNLPLDVLAIILSHCHPSDLLQLGRTCYDLKAFFSSEASKSIWSASRKTLSFTITDEDVAKYSQWEPPKTGTFRLPDCPSYLSEPAYAAYLFEPKCAYCQLREDGFKGQTVRVCWPCSRNDFVSLNDLKKEWRKDADPRLYAILPHIGRGFNGKKPRATEKVYHKPTAQSIFDRAFHYDLEVQCNPRMMNAFFARGEAEIKEREAFTKAYVAFNTAELQHGRLMTMKRNREKDEQFERNKNFVVSRLEQDGFGETFYTDIDDSANAVRLLRHQDCEMDDADFASIKSELIEHLRPVQEQRRYMTAYYDAENARVRDLLDDYRVTLPPMDGVAGIIRLADFVELPACRALANNSSFVNGADGEQGAIWLESFDSIWQDIEAWVAAKQQTILSIIVKDRSSADHSDQVNELELSSELLQKPFVLLKCQKCGFTAQSTPSEVLDHDCFAAYPSHSLHHTRRRLNAAGYQTYGAFESPLVFTSEALHVDWKRTLVRKAIYNAVVRVGGEAPKTMAAVRHKKGILRCDECDEDSAERQGTTVALSSTAHCGSYSWSDVKLHTRFTYVLPAGGIEEDINDDASTPLPHFGEMHGYTSDLTFDYYMDYMHGGMMADMDADLMMMYNDGMSDDS